MEGVPFVRRSDSPKGGVATFSFGVAVIATAQPNNSASKKDLADYRLRPAGKCHSSRTNFRMNE
ncbi:MAG: hypothetical protein LBR10_01760 [Prevotellaceae bacterium]|nr:hypothetical protein [Prevotellaceae bacterium]